MLRTRSYVQKPKRNAKHLNRAYVKQGETFALAIAPAGTFRIDDCIPNVTWYAASYSYLYVFRSANGLRGMCDRRNVDFARFVRRCPSGMSRSRMPFPFPLMWEIHGTVSDVEPTLSRVLRVVGPAGRPA